MTERARDETKIALKMQARSVDPAAASLRKKRHRRRRVKGRIGKQASTETGQRTRTGALIRGRQNRLRGVKGLRHSVSDAVF